MIERLGQIKKAPIHVFGLPLPPKRATLTIAKYRLYLRYAESIVPSCRSESNQDQVSLRVSRFLRHLSIAAAVFPEF